jgi:hypothetical protein
MISAAIYLFLSVATSTPTIGAADCRHDNAALLAMAPEQFDQDPRGGWRPLGATEGCEPVAADLLASYRKAHWGTLDTWQLHINYWHEGQLRAVAGQSDRAVRLLLAGIAPEGSMDFEDYALGSVAFLQHDLPALKSARARLAGQIKPDWFAKSQPQAKWPPNLDVLDGFITCFDKPYGVAYGAACRPATAP